MTFASSIELDGENTGTPKLTVPQVLDIKRRLSDGVDFYHDIAAEYGVSMHTIRNIKKGHSWSWLKSESSTPPHRGRKRLTSSKVIEIRRRLAAGEGYATISEEFGVSTQTLKNIKLRHTWARLYEGDEKSTTPP